MSDATIQGVFTDDKNCKKNHACFKTLQNVAIYALLRKNFLQEKLLRGYLKPFWDSGSTTVVRGGASPAYTAVPK